MPKNILSQLDMMELGNPKCTQTWLNDSLVSSHPEIIFIYGIKNTHFSEMIHHKKTSSHGLDES